MKKTVALLLMLTLALTACTNADNVEDTLTEDPTPETTLSADIDTDLDTEAPLYTCEAFEIRKDGAAINVITDGEIKGTYDECFLLQNENGGFVPFLLENVTDNTREPYVNVHKLGENGESISFLTAKTAVQHGNFIVTDERVFDSQMRMVAHFPTYVDGFTVSALYGYDYYIIVEGTDKNGDGATFHYTEAEVSSSARATATAVMVDGKIRVSYAVPAWGTGGKAIGMLWVGTHASSEDVGTFGEYVTYRTPWTLSLIKDNTVVHTYAGSEYDLHVFDDYFVVGNGKDELMVAYDTSLDRAFDEEFTQFEPLDDGNYIAEVVDEAGYRVYNAAKELIYSSGSSESSEILQFGADYVLRRSDTGKLELFDPYGELLCELGTVTDTMNFHPSTSGVYTKDDVVGYYFIFEDIADKDSGGTHGFEYYYIPSTGEHGMIDNGYSSFAYAKPVLYLYPTEECDVTVTFAHPERLTTVYPAYNDGWRVTASPDGTLTDSRGRSYYALYWEESSDTPFYHFTDGFCVAGENSAAFLEEKLSALGFTEREANEFIIYWLPIMEANEYNIIRFELTAEREAANALHITPKPDSLLRMAMHIKPSDSPVEIAEQVLPTFERSGFTAVEWGGCVH